MSLERHGLRIVRNERAFIAPAGEDDTASIARGMLDGIHESLGRQFGLTREASAADIHDPTALIARWLIDESSEVSPLQVRDMREFDKEDRVIDFATQRREIQTLFSLDDHEFIFYVGHYLTPQGREGYVIACHSLHVVGQLAEAGRQLASERVEKGPDGQWTSSQIEAGYPGTNQIEHIAQTQASWARGYQVIIRDGPQFNRPSGQQMRVARAA